MATVINLNNFDLGFEPAKLRHRRPAIIMFGASWCPHCKHARPDFDKLASNGSVTSKADVFYVETDSIKQYAQKIIPKYQGVPTFCLYRGDGVILYDGNRSYQDLVNFVTQNV